MSEKTFSFVKREIPLLFFVNCERADLFFVKCDLYPPFTTLLDGCSKDEESKMPFV